MRRRLERRAAIIHDPVVKAGRTIPAQTIEIIADRIEHVIKRPHLQSIEGVVDAGIKAELY
jgi:hypothetical protein